MEVLKMLALHFGPTVAFIVGAVIALRFDVYWLAVAFAISAMSWSFVIALTDILKRGFTGKQ